MLKEGYLVSSELSVWEDVMPVNGTAGKSILGTVRDIPRGEYIHRGY
jgi:hypothetical protein